MIRLVTKPWLPRMLGVAIVALVTFGIWVTTHATWVVAHGGDKAFNGTFDYPWWSGAHFVAALVFVTILPFQLSSRIRNAHRRVHRIAGRVAAICGVAFSLTGLMLPFVMPARPFGERAYMATVGVPSHILSLVRDRGGPPQGDGDTSALDVAGNGRSPGAAHRATDLSCVCRRRDRQHAPFLGSVCHRALVRERDQFHHRRMVDSLDGKPGANPAPGPLQRTGVAQVGGVEAAYSEPDDTCQVCDAGAQSKAFVFQTVAV